MFVKKGRIIKRTDFCAVAFNLERIPNRKKIIS